MIEYKVILWNVNTDRVEHYDIMPYLYRRLEEKRKKRQITLKDLTLENMMTFRKESLQEYQNTRVHKS